MREALGKTTWLIPDMYWPAVTCGNEYVSHEAICVLNTADSPANVSISLYYEDRPVIDLEPISCPGMRTSHLRMDNLLLSDGQHIPRGVGYAAVVQSDLPVVVQYTRLDTSQPELALMTTMGFAL